MLSIADFNNLVKQINDRGVNTTHFESAFQSGVNVAYNFTDSRERSHYDVRVGNHLVKLGKWEGGFSAGCSSCSKVHKSGYTPHLDSDCPAIAIAIAAFMVAEKQRITRVGTYIILEESPITPPSPIEEAAADIVAEHDGDDFDGRLGRAVELVEAGEIDFPDYQTTYDGGGFHGFRSCNCPDATYRPRYANFGGACKHTIAQEILARMEATMEAVAYRKWFDTVSQADDTDKQQAEWEARHPEDDYGLGGYVYEESEEQQIYY